MRLNSVKILKISVTASSKKEILEYVRKYLEKKAKGKRQKAKLKTKPLIIVTPNSEQIVYAQRDKHFAQILNRADITLPDGVGVVLADRFLNAKCQMPNAKWKLQRIPGVEFMEDLVDLAAKQGYLIALIGGRGGLAVESLDCLRRKHLGLVGWAEDGPEIEVKSSKLKVKSGKQKLITPNGEQEDYFQQLAQHIRESGVKMAFVGLGAPKQEFFIESLVYHLSLITYHSLVLMAVGGSFDIIAGRLPRAPRLIRVIALEWLWRMLQEPWRWKRQIALARFIWLVIAQKLRI